MQVPSRVIRGEINSSASLSRVSVGAELTFDRLITAVDDYGRFDARPEMLKAGLFPVRADAPPHRVMEWIGELAREGCVRLYEVDGRPYLAMTAWEKHFSKQRRADKSRYPTPPGVVEPTRLEGVYFVRSGDSGPIKIGHSTGLKNRFETLRTTVPNLEILAVLPDEGRAAEKRLHRQFAHIKVDREWFRADTELLEWIDQNGQSWAAVGSGGQSRALPGTAHPYGCGVEGDECSEEVSSGVCGPAASPPLAPPDSPQGEVSNTEPESFQSPEGESVRRSTVQTGGGLTLQDDDISPEMLPSPSPELSAAVRRADAAMVQNLADRVDREIMDSVEADSPQKPEDRPGSTNAPAGDAGVQQRDELTVVDAEGTVAPVFPLDPFPIVGSDEVERGANVLGNQPGTRAEQVAWMRENLDQILADCEKAGEGGAGYRSRAIRYYRQHLKNPGGKKPQHDEHRSWGERDARSIKRKLGILDD